jgi:hypothetical protein
LDGRKLSIRLIRKFFSSLSSCFKAFIFPQRQNDANVILSLVAKSHYCWRVFSTTQARARNRQGSLDELREQQDNIVPIVIVGGGINGTGLSVDTRATVGRPTLGNLLQ